MTKMWSLELAPISSVHLQRSHEHRKSVDHKEGSLGFLVNQLVKNWEKEASYKGSGAPSYQRSTASHAMEGRCTQWMAYSGWILTTLSWERLLTTSPRTPCCGSAVGSGAG
ncbi:hypothetical protein WJX79_009300 [Trebouxia sp. C0005]